MASAYNREWNVGKAPCSLNHARTDRRIPRFSYTRSVEEPVGEPLQPHLQPGLRRLHQADIFRSRGFDQHQAADLIRVHSAKKFA